MEKLWQIMRHLGYSEKIVRQLEKLYGKTLSIVRVDGDIILAQNTQNDNYRFEYFPLPTNEIIVKYA